MKTKKISWQAIAIVVLALVLIASIALGVSGAWFQDKDAADQDITMGAPVLIKLANTTDGGEVESFGSKYKIGVKAFPGDFVLGATKIMAASDTATIYRAKIVTDVKDAEGNDITVTAMNAEQATTFEGTYTGNYEDWTGANPNGDVTYTNDEIAYNLYLINNMLANLENTDWSAKEGVTDGYIYYKEVSTASELTLFANGLNLSEKLTNACNGWQISVSLEVEAIQAANANADGFPWNTDDMPTALVTSITNHNDGRLPAAE